MATSTSSSPSEGEIVESDSEKATTSLVRNEGTNVDRQSRKGASLSRSPSPIRSPKGQQARSRSRSPYREPRGAKRPLKDDHYDRSRNDSRRFKVRYEDETSDGKGAQRFPHHGPDRFDGSDRRLRYEDRDVRSSAYDKRRDRRNHSPTHPRSHQGDQMPYHGKSRGSQVDRRPMQKQGDRGYGESKNKLSKAQSVSGRGQSPIAAAQGKRETEIRTNQTQHDDRPTGLSSHVSANAMDSINDLEMTRPAVGEQPIDEATLIEERRKRREAIKAKHRGQATPVLVQALALDNKSATSSPKPIISEVEPQIGASPHRSPPNTPRDTSGQESPTSFLVLKDSDLANANAASNEPILEDGPSAADYDPTMDMQEDKLRQDQHQRKEDIPSGAYIETKMLDQDILLPDNPAQEIPVKDAEDDFDMFAEGDELDMFADVPFAKQRQDKEVNKAVPIPQAKALDMSMLDDWDDIDGYYKVILGELLDNRYHVQSNLGKGMFSGVVRATDQKTNRLVAIKLIRSNETMKKAGLKEIEILQKLLQSDPEDKKHIIRLERYFEHKGHLCMVFENLSINLREVLKKFGRDVGINLKAVRAYAQQMFLGLSLLRKCNVLHADLKPDNVLVNDTRNVLKICDLGSASDASENEITQYLVSRFYRAPEIILGMPYDFAIDMWSIGCTLFELYTGKILFTGRSNNQMLRAIMECRGKFSHKILRKSQFAGLHFDDLLNFRSVEKDRLSGKDVVRILNFTKPTRDLKARLMANVKGMNEGEIKELTLFVELLDRCLNLNPERRCTPTEALKHPFIMRAKG